MELCQDTNPDVRRIMCGQLGALCTAVGCELASSEVLPEILELLLDEESEVKLQAYRTMLSVMHLFPVEVHLEQIIPALLTLVTDEEYMNNENVARSFGIAICQLAELDALHAETSVSLLEVYVKMAYGQNDEIRHLCAFNFPAMLHAFGVAQYATQLDAIYQHLAHDKSEIVRSTIASGIGKVADIFGSQRVLKYLKAMVISLLGDTDLLVRSNMVAHLELILTHFAAAKDETAKLTSLHQVLTLCTKYEEDLPESQWRARATFLKSYYHLPKWFDCSKLYDNVIPNVFKILRTSARPVQIEALRVILWYTRQSTIQSQRFSNISRLRTEYGKGASAWQKILYIDACALVLKFNSCRYFKQIFLEHALELIEVS